MALTWANVSEPGRCAEPTVWNLLHLLDEPEHLEETERNLGLMNGGSLFEPRLRL